MHKISVNKTDEVSLIISKIIESDSKEIVLAIPRFAVLADSVENFRLLKREVDAMGKKVIIESVDDKILELADSSGIEAINPFFVKNKKQFSDIVVPGRKATRTAPSKTKVSEKKEEIEEVVAQPEELVIESKSIKKAGKKISKAEEERRKDEEFFEALASNLHKREKQIIVPEEVEELPKQEVIQTEYEEQKPSLIKRLPIKTLAVLIVLGFGAYAAATVLPKADIKIVSKKTDWAYNDSVVTQKSAKVDYVNLTIPNQVFTQTKNLNMQFPATGKKQVENKAVGKITVYNSYSSDPQTLVKNTRFLSPDGKIFLLTKQILVPGAKISEGKIIPSSIDTDVIAEKAGEDYNVGPVKTFSIPGFKGSPKFQAFYGESKDAMKGGFVGEIAYPTAFDIATSTAQIKNALQNDLKNTLYTQISSDFKILDDAIAFSITKQVNNEEVNKDGNFSIFAEGQMSIIAFKEADAIDVLKKKAESVKGEEYAVKNYELEYGISRMDVATGRLSFPVNFKALLAYKIDVDELKKQIAGKSDIELRKAIFSLPALDTANVSLWPFWVKTVPNKLNKINIAID